MLQEHEELFGEGLQSELPAGIPPLDKDQAFDRLVQSGQLKGARRRIRGYRLAAVACAVLLALGFSFYGLIRSGNPTQQQAIRPTVEKADDSLMDTASGAIQLADGTHLEIEEIQQQAVRYDQVTLSKVDGDLIRVDLAEPASSSSSGFHEFRTKKGVSYRLLLPDGTKVHLNSGSVLKLDVGFNVANRQCDLSGEGFFDVAKHPRWPFNVRTRDYAIQVLGTQFNLKAYPQMDASSTALLEGRVELTAPGKRLVLAPGQQVENTANEEWIKTSANFREILAWRDGYFRFSNKPLQEIMDDIITWYGVDEVIYEREVNDRFTGSIVRSRSLSDVLHGMEKIANLNFEIKERRIIVSK